MRRRLSDSRIGSRGWRSVRVGCRKLVKECWGPWGGDKNGVNARELGIGRKSLGLRLEAKNWGWSVADDTKTRG